MTKNINKGIAERLKDIEARGLLRSATLVSAAGDKTGTRVSINGKDVLNLCSNDYLGLAMHPLLKEAAIKATEKYGTGATASRLVSGTGELHVELEERLAEFMGSEAALVFNSGYHANMGAIPALAGRTDDVFTDKLNHASLVDACVLSRSNVKRYPHLDTTVLEGLLKESTARNKLIVTDSVFSMDGDRAPLDDILRLAEDFDASVYLDEAHAFGTLGVRGQGLGEAACIAGIADVERSRLLRMGTLGKAAGGFGAFVVSNRPTIELLRNRARSFAFSTALPPAVCASAIKALEIIEAEPERRRRLSDNAAFILGSLNEAGLNTQNSSTHIIPILIKDAGATMEMSRKLLDKGVFIQGIRPPTVPEGTSRLRITVTSELTKDDLSFAASAIIEAAADLLKEGALSS